MHNSKIFFSVLLLFCCRFCFCNTTGEPVFTKKETLYSTKSGNPIGELTLSIEAKGGKTKNNEWHLTIGDNSGNLINAGHNAGNNKTLWIFSKKTNAGRFKKDLKNRDYALEVKDLSEFLPFCENGIRFDLKEWEEIRKQTQRSFFINAASGEKVTLRLVFYTSSKDKKRTLIEDEAKVKIEFVVPDPASLARKNEAKQQQQEDELISLTEKIDYEAAAKIREEREADSVKLAEVEDLGRRTGILNSFITERNNEINTLQSEVNALFGDKKNKVETSKIDSFETVVEELKKKVDYWEKGYTDILLTDEAIHDKFSKFGTSHGLTVKKIAELRQQQNPLSGVTQYVQENWLLSIGIAAGLLILMKLLYSLSRKLLSKAKNSFTQKMKKAKENAKNRKQQKAMKEKEKDEIRKDFDNIDINDLHQI